MSRISGLGDSATGFDPGDDNDGQLVSPDAYEGGGTSKRDIANDIIDQMGGGKAFGFNLDNVVSAMVSADMMDQIPDLQRDITNTNVRISALGKLQSLMAELKKTTLDPIEAGLSPYTIQSSDQSDISVSGAANSSSTPYTAPFQVNVTNIAKINSWVFSSAQSNPTSSIAGTGELTIGLGSGQSTSIQIPSNSSLTDIANAINTSGAGVTASIVQQSDGYHLAVASNATGTKNEITFGFTDAQNDAVKTLFDSKQETQPAADAAFSINGVPMISSDNDITYNGVLFTMNKDNSNATINTKTDTTAVSQSITTFVSNYNELVGQVSSMESAVPGKSYQGAFYQDDDIADLTSSLRSMLAGTLANGSSLGNLGMNFNSDGTLSLDSSQLDDALSANPNIGADVLSTNMSASDASVNVVGYNKTKNLLTSETTSGQYSLNVIQAASASSFTSENALSVSSGSVTLGSQVVMDLSVSGESNPGKFTGSNDTTDVKVTIPAGTYTTAQLAQNIQKQINSNADVEKDNATVAVEIDSNNHLKITSSAVGALTGFKFNPATSSNLSELGISTSDAAATGYFGKDVAGKINGQLCLSDGAYLEAQDDGTKTAASGLIVKLNGTKTGDLGTVTLSIGYADQLDTLFSNLNYQAIGNDEGDGELARKESDYQKALDPNNLSSLTAQLKEAQAKQDQLTEMYFQRYQGINSMLSEMSGVQDYISSAFDNSKD